MCSLLCGLQAAGFIGHPWFARIQHFVDPTVVNRRSKFQIMQSIPLIKSYLKEPQRYLTRNPETELSAKTSAEKNKELSKKKKHNNNKKKKKLGAAPVHDSVYRNVYERQFLAMSSLDYSARREAWLNEANICLHVFVTRFTTFSASEKRRTELYLDAASTWKWLHTPFGWWNQTSFL